ncbi:protein eyes shut homolog [Brienomyrus brachyistius]|uniref:protein eyes shut homolog n=1 Tax=Brienomyrus brachyistius TaxID=42636 RepID=UPI0020B1D63C|nr:protein eyes shut homolog [Brienomyrus brachyistius]
MACKADADECSSPCQNGAACVDQPDVDGFRCVCEPGFAAPQCECTTGDCGGHTYENSWVCQDPHSVSMRGSCLHVNRRPMPSPSDGDVYCYTLLRFLSFPLSSLSLFSSLSLLTPHFPCSRSLGWTGPDCSVHLPECDLVQCQNGGACVESTTPGGFSCVCPPQYAGTLCQLPDNPCDPQQPPCRYNSTCTGSGGGETACRCQPGLRCEMMHRCVSQPCWNSTGGETGPYSYRCVCPEGLPGATCRTDTAGCINGSCINTESECRCCCEAGWTKDSCDTDINECSSNPCLNSTSCMDWIARYACICWEGYTGMSCEVDVDVCRESLIFLLCRNGGLCLDGPGSSFTCSCPAGFTGTTCEVEVNECDSDPCFNGAVCQDPVSGYHCRCLPGWTDLRCDTDMNECLLEACEQGLRIQNLPGHGCTCFCRPGFVGRHCKYNNHDCLLHTCPPDHRCMDGINNVTCIPIVACDQTVTLAPLAFWSSIQTDLPSVAGDTETLREATHTSALPMSGVLCEAYEGDPMLTQ